MESEYEDRASVNAAAMSADVMRTPIWKVESASEDKVEARRSERPFARSAREPISAG